MESESLAERILQDLGNVFKKEPLVKEFDVVPVSNSSCNRSPVVCVDGHLALGSWCVPHVYGYAYSRLVEARNNIVRHEKESILGWSRLVILVNPDVQLAWNVRKELFLCKQTSFQEELQFSQLVLTRKPKCSEVFSHRRWLMEHNLRGFSSDRANVILQEELKVCLQAADRYRCNYYAWTYRIWLMDRFVHGNPLMLESEMQQTRDWVRSHVSDCSGFHYRQYLLRRVGSVPLLSRELSLCEELCLLHPGHEAIWAHRRFCLWHLHPLPSSNGVGETQAKRARNSASSHWTPRDEEAFLASAKGCGEWQDALVARHARWLRDVLGWTASGTP
ncbi:protein prenyltransferase alpha subunit repeat-containing protein 1 [Ixodes scapularis]|uniref:protein prenyltransferase alpha subunit repeat-containing protein 1 n=1 Tax=Ixodes scapularis TaxID=6945 RepID=UPI001161B743|nr:protein prenyltransferase alpha subunit repeat-containing protein 1 [Ixodes scapularis]